MDSRAFGVLEWERARLRDDAVREWPEWGRTTA